MNQWDGIIAQLEEEQRRIRNKFTENLVLMKKFSESWIAKEITHSHGFDDSWLKNQNMQIPGKPNWLRDQIMRKENMSVPNDKKGAELWIESIKTKADVEKRRVSIRGWIEPLRMLIQAGKNELPPDTQGGGNLDVAQQVVTEIEKANEG